jgi:ribosome-interacting GTPase 1
MMQVNEKIKEIKDFLKNVPKELSDSEHSKYFLIQSSLPSKDR